MAAGRSEVLLVGPTRPVIASGLAGFNLHKLGPAPDRDAFSRRSPTHALWR
jgi:hypothetical protein